MTEETVRSESVLVFTPTGRDGDLICETLARAGIKAVGCSTLDQFLKELDGGAAIVAEEALKPEALSALRKWLKEQPPWSDFPFIVLTSGGESTAGSLRSYERLKELGNITLLERPVRVVTLVSGIQAALRSRRRQFETKAYIDERIRAEELLAEQAEQLARSNADLQQFAYVSSHDLQEPLRTIHSYSQLLQRKYTGQLDDQAQEFLGFILSGAGRMEDLIRDLLAYSRLVHVEKRPFTPVSMDVVVTWAVQNLQLAIAENGATIRSNDLPTVWGDQIQLIQLLQNLLSNALKYRKPDLIPEIEIGAEKQDGHWLFRVSDNGQGIAPEYHERIFGLFKRLHGKSVPGTGIGLSICRKIVQQHHGRMWVESTDGQGTTFCFTLPGSEQQHSAAD